MKIKEDYFVIVIGEDGINVDHLSKATLIERLDEHYYGNDLKFLDKVPEEYSDNWNVNSTNSAIVIKGHVIQPTTKRTVIEYEVE